MKSFFIASTLYGDTSDVEETHTLWAALFAKVASSRGAHYLCPAFVWLTLSSLVGILAGGLCVRTCWPQALRATTVRFGAVRRSAGSGSASSVPPVPVPQRLGFQFPVRFGGFLDYELPYWNWSAKNDVQSSKCGANLAGVKIC